MRKPLSPSPTKMKQDVSFCGFCDNFPDSYRNNFTYEGKRALYEYLIQLEEDLGKEIECDIIAFCCEYTEYENLDDFIKNYQPNIDRKDYENDDDYYDDVESYIEEMTTLILIGGCTAEGFIVYNF